MCGVVIVLPRKRDRNHLVVIHVYRERNKGRGAETCRAGCTRARESGGDVEECLGQVRQQGLSNEYSMYLLTVRDQPSCVSSPTSHHRSLSEDCGQVYLMAVIPSTHNLKALATLPSCPFPTADTTDQPHSPLFEQPKP
jgi:hypothetical protein